MKKTPQIKEVVSESEIKEFDRYALKIKLKWLLAYPKADIENQLNNLSKNS